MTTQPIKMHGENRECQSELAMWREETSVWMKELQQLVEGMSDLRDSIDNHRRLLEEHSEDIWDSENEVGLDEHLVTLAARRAAKRVPRAMSQKHEETMEITAMCDEGHEAMKKRHHGVMTAWAALMKSFRRPE